MSHTNETDPSEPTEGFGAGIFQDGDGSSKPTAEPAVQPAPAPAPDPAAAPEPAPEPEPAASPWGRAASKPEQPKPEPDEVEYDEDEEYVDEDEDYEDDEDLAPAAGEGFARFDLGDRIQRGIEEAGYRDPRPIQAGCAQEEHHVRCSVVC